MKKSFVVIISGISVSVIAYLAIQSVYHQQYLDIEISGLKEEYNLRESITGKVVLSGYWELCGTFKIELNHQVMNFFYDCIADPQPAQIHEAIPFVFNSDDLQPGNYIIKASFYKKLTEETITIKNP